MPAVTSSKPFDVETEIHPPLRYGAIEGDIPYERIYGNFKAAPKFLKNSDNVLSVTEWLGEFDKLLKSNFEDEKLLDKLFMTFASWKDHMCLSWQYHQWHYLDSISKQLQDREPNFQMSDLEIDSSLDFTRFPTGVALQTVHELTDNKPPIEFLMSYIKFKTKFGYGKGLIRFASVEDGSKSMLKLLTVFTSLDSLKDHPELLGVNRPEGVNHGQNVGRKIWLEERAKDFEFGGDKQPVVLIVGGGQSGLATAARLKTLGVQLLIVEKNARIGDNWRQRYSFLVLHDPVWADHLPILHFPENWPIFTPKDKLGDWFQSYADSMELSYWTNRYVNSATFDEKTKTWEVQVIDNETTEMTVLRPKHVVLATGHSGEPNIPHFRDEEKFKGKLIHSSKHKTGLEYNGENTIVVGSCNSAHDIAQDFYEQGANVTMIQRSSTCVINVDKGLHYICDGVFAQNGPNQVSTADLLNNSMPVPFLNLMQQQCFRKTVVLERDMIDKLESRGFKLDAGYGGTGLFGKYYRRGGGYYIDVGGSSMIVEDKIHLKQGVEIKRFFEDGVELTDGTRIENVKAVVLATGYLNMKTTASKLFGDEIAKPLKNVWGLNSEGEIEAIFTDSGRENFWYAAGNLAIVRYFSKKLAMRIVAQENGLVV